MRDYLGHLPKTLHSFVEDYTVNKTLEMLTTPCCNKDYSLLDACSSAAFWNKLCCLKYLHKNGVRWDHKVYLQACRNGDLVMLQYAFDNGCPIDPQRFQVGYCRNFEILQFMRSIVGCTTWNEETCALFAGKNKLTCLRYAHENGCPWDEKTTMEAAVNSSLRCLKYAHEAGCPLSESFCLKVVEYARIRVPSSIECLQYVIDKGASSTDPKLLAAAAHTYSYLKYFHEIGVPVTKQVTLEAIKHGSVDCFLYCIEHKFPYDLDVCLLAAELRLRKNEEIINYFQREKNTICKCIEHRRKNPPPRSKVV